MDDPLHLIGFKHSVYTWVVRLALAEMGLKADYVEANPFAEPPDPVLARYTPLRRVPVLQHGTFQLTETTAILRYLDAMQAGRSLQPKDDKAAARMNQIIGIVDADVYPIMVRQVFSLAYYMPVVEGQAGDAEVIQAGLRRAKPALGLLDQIAAEGLQLTGTDLSLADLHLTPMMAYFVQVPEGAEAVRGYPALSAWWQLMAERPCVCATDPLASMTPRG